jgi:STE24 endopeptidase
MDLNGYAVFILAALALTTAVEWTAQALNLKALSPELPPEFAGVFDAEKYRKSQEYVRARARLEAAASVAGLAALLAFWFLGGLVRGWELGAVASGLAFVGLLFLLQYLLSLPFDAWSTFVVEERFGFNRTTVRTFVADRLKGLALGALIGGALLAAVLWFFGWAGARGWLYAWAAAAAFRVVLELAGPTLIMPLFNKFTPLPDGELRTAIFDYARSVGFPLDNIFVMDGSKRSSKTNAFFTGFGKHKRIALFDTLVHRHTVPELVSVMAHEIGHYKKRHVWSGLALSLANYGLIFWLLSLFLRDERLFAAFGAVEPSVYAGLVFFSVLYSPLSCVLSIGLQAISRRHEYEADRYAYDTTRDPAPMVSALKTLSASNLSNLTPHPFYVFLHYTHPPVLQRIRALEAAARA